MVITMKLVKLFTHPKDFRDADLVLNSKEYPDLRIGDVVEIYHPENEYSRLLLQVKSVNDDFQQKDAISVAQVIAVNFHLRVYKDVYINVVNPRDVALDLVELTFKEQYFGRADMWRLRRYLVDTCVHLMKEVKFTAMRAQVHELWSKGVKVTCGYITEDTRVTYRSSTAQVNIFIQMSCEMWQFDHYGDLYFEKAVNGFLIDLFREWKEKSCNHDVTITLFSRTFYSAKSIDDFPMFMRDCIEQDYLGRFYEDFYRVVVQNEKYEDWTGTVIKLKTLFNEYPDRVLNYHKQRRHLHEDSDTGGHTDIPAAHNSTAAQGNLLEVLNMALNVFETYYLDQNFERTGKLSVVITPGPGVFEVDRELTNITKQRTIDCGNNSDLVCMGEQPLHVVPLFKFHNKNPSISLDVGDDYNIPHWINHSFYTSRSQAECMSQRQFVPRIKMPVELPSCQPDSVKKEVRQTSPVDLPVSRPGNTLITDEMPFLDYDEYDAQVFKRPPVRASKYNTAMQPKKSCSSSIVTSKYQRHSITAGNSNPSAQLTQHDTTTTGSSAVKMGASSTPTNIVTRRHSATDNYLGDTQSDTQDETDEVIIKRPLVGSAGSPVGHHSHYSLHNYRPHRALINPFAPRRLHLKVTSIRRRWTHAFPTGLAEVDHCRRWMLYGWKRSSERTLVTMKSRKITRCFCHEVQRNLLGMSVQPHHKHGSFHTDTQQHMENSSPPTREVIQAARNAVELRKNKTHRSSESSDSQDNPYCLRSRSITYSSTAGGSVDSLKDVHARELTHVPSSSAMSTVDSQSSLNSLIPVCEKDGGVCAGSSGRFCPHSVGLYSRSASYHKDLGPLGADQVGHSWLWGVTGEQEWTIEIKTGMDWPSMTLPASLPLTTDYFPDKRSIQLDYVISDYSVVPENVMPDQSSNSLGAGHKLVTTLQVYKEMIATRIARGFQIVLQQSKSGSIAGNLSSSPYQTGTASRWRSVPKSETPEEITLSNGRIFHKLTLNGQTVTVTRYWTRHPYDQKTHHYTYRFQVPDSETYDVSWTQFTNDKLEKYNWNHLDQYVTTRGEEGFGLIESLKYWRSRSFLLPSNNAATRRIADGDATLCDIYEERTVEEKSQLIDAFLRFIEHLNKIKRTVQARLMKVDSLTRRTSIPHLSPSPDPLTSKQKVMGKVAEVTLDMLPVGGISAATPVGMEHRRASFAGHQVRGSIDECPGLLSGGGKTGEGIISMEKSQRLVLSKTASSAEVVAAMMDITWGLKFLNRTQQCPVMPDYCFVSAEAANWLVETLEGDTSISEATDMLQRLTDDRVICHASGNSRHRFIYGFYLYFISCESEKKGTAYESYNVSFQNEWCEVAINCHDNCTGNTHIPEFPQREQSLDQTVAQSGGSKTEHGHSWGGGGEHSQLTVSPLYKVVNVNIDPSGKSDREEYGTLRYHGNYSTSAAFELELRWIVGTGTILEELVSNWARKAGLCFHLISVPGDPFALPFTSGSDPLRGPIFVPLYLNCLTQTGQELFQDDESDSQQTRLHAFQECILRRYGFLRDRCQPERCRRRSTVQYTDIYPQYVHCTGGMFVMIPDNRTTSPLPRQRKEAVNSHTEYITRQRSWTGKSRNNGANGGNKEQKEHRSYYEVGFLWTWNFMMTKRTANTGDEFFQDRMLADFRSFCANANGRLRHLWDETRTTDVKWEQDNMTWDSQGKDLG